MAKVVRAKNVTETTQQHRHKKIYFLGKGIKSNKTKTLKILVALDLGSVAPCDHYKLDFQASLAYPVKYFHELFQLQRVVVAGVRIVG